MQDLIINTLSKDNIKVRIDARMLESHRLFLYMDAKRLSNLCKKFCRNYDNKWSCPPYAPTFIEYAENYNKVFIIQLTLDLDQLSYINQAYLKVKAGNAILKSRGDKLAKSLSNEVSGKYISSGSCRLCKPCKLKSGEQCCKPKLMAPSYEAMGLNVEEFSKYIFDHELLWYKDKILPAYTTVYVGILTNTELDMRQIEELSAKLLMEL